MITPPAAPAAVMSGSPSESSWPRYAPPAPNGESAGNDGGDAQHEAEQPDDGEAIAETDPQLGRVKVAKRLPIPPTCIQNDRPVGAGIGSVNSGRRRPIARPCLGVLVHVAR